MERFRVIAIEALQLDLPAEISGWELMSPYVWTSADGTLAILIRAVPPEGHSSAHTGSIWYGTGDGLRFTIEAGAVLAPRAGALDAGGCEDPTVVLSDGRVLVFYSGVDANGGIHLLWAEGASVRSLEPRGLALGQFGEGRDFKELEVVRDGDRWTIGYEYVADGVSVIGYAEGDGPEGPWREMPNRLDARPDRFDSWHRSPGPMLLRDPDRPVMFYNGSDKEARWAIGWIIFDRVEHRTVDRCQQALIHSPGEDRGRNMAFGASLIDGGDVLYLYLTYNDRTLHRAKIAQLRASTC